MTHVTGHDPALPLQVTATNGTTSISPSSPSITTTSDGALILRLGAFDNTSITAGTPGVSSHTALAMASSSSSSGKVVFEGFSEAKQSSNTKSLTINTPAGTSEGDLLIAALTTDSSETLSAPGGEGWNLLNEDVGSGSVTLGVWWKLADASESASHQFTWGSNERAYGWIMRFTGHDPTNPIDAFSVRGGGNDSTPKSPSVTTSVGNALVVRIGGFDDDDITIDNTGLGGFTTITMDKSGTGSGTASGGAAYLEQAVTGASGTLDFSLTASEQNRCLTLSIAPASVVSGGGVSGGMAYVEQISAGASGTASFSLTGSEKSRLLTIAVAPAPPASVSGGAGYVEQASAGTSGPADFALTATEEAQTVTVVIAPATP